MNKYELFNIREAKKYLTFYKWKKQYSKEMLTTELINWQHLFGNTSIVGVKISPSCCFGLKTVLEVLDDLGYTLTSYQVLTSKTSRIGKNKHQLEIIFVPK